MASLHIVKKGEFMTSHVCRASINLKKGKIILENVKIESKYSWKFCKRITIRLNRFLNRVSRVVCILPNMWLIYSCFCLHYDLRSFSVMHINHSCFQVKLKQLHWEIPTFKFNFHEVHLAFSFDVEVILFCFFRKIVKALMKPSFRRIFWLGKSSHNVVCE